MRRGGVLQWRLSGRLPASLSMVIPPPPPFPGRCRPVAGSGCDARCGSVAPEPEPGGCHHGSGGRGGRRRRGLHSVAAGEVRQPGGAGAAKRLPGAEHPLRPHPPRGALPPQHGRRHGRGDEGQRLPPPPPPPAPRQPAPDGGDAAGGGGGAAGGHPALGRPLPHLHPPEQPPVRGHLQPARGHLPGHLPAEDPHHRPLLRPAAGHLPLPPAVALLGPPLRRGGLGPDRTSPGLGGRWHLGDGPGRSPPKLRRGLGRRGRLLPLLGLRRRLLREAPEDHGGFHLGAQRPAGGGGDSGGAGGHGGRRRLGGGRLGLLLRLQPGRLGRGGQPGGGGAAGGRGGPSRRQHLEGLRHRPLHRGLHLGLCPPLRLPAAGDLLGRHRHGLGRRLPLRAAPGRGRWPPSSRWRPPKCCCCCWWWRRPPSSRWWRPRTARRGRRWQVSLQGQGLLMGPAVPPPRPYRGHMCPPRPYRGHMDPLKTIGAVWTPPPPPRAL